MVMMTVTEMYALMTVVWSFSSKYDDDADGRCHQKKHCCHNDLVVTVNDRYMSETLL